MRLLPSRTMSHTRTFCVAVAFELRDPRVPIADERFAKIYCLDDLLPTQDEAGNYSICMYCEADSLQSAVLEAVAQVRTLLPDASVIETRTDVDDVVAFTKLLIDSLEPHKVGEGSQDWLNAGACALERLLCIAERSIAGQASSVAEFIASMQGYVRFDIFNLRAVDEEISNDMLTCLEVIRWGKVPITDLLAGGAERAEAVSHKWGHRAAPLTDGQAAYLRQKDKGRALRLLLAV